MKANSNVVAFTDGDTVVPHGWIENYLKVVGKNGVVASTGPLKPLEDNSIRMRINFFCGIHL